MVLQNANSFNVKKEFDLLTEKLINVLEEGEDQRALEQIDNRNLQQLLESLIKIYSDKVQMADQNPANVEEAVQPLVENNNLSQTDAVIFADQILRQKDIELFEVQMFRSIG